MRGKDIYYVTFASVIFGFVLNIVCFFIWSDTYHSITNSFWIAWMLLSALSAPISYKFLKGGSSCKACGKAWTLSNTSQTDLENFTTWKSESVTENNVTRTVNVPYNVRRYIQHVRCDNCGNETQYETKDERKA